MNFEKKISELVAGNSKLNLSYLRCLWLLGKYRSQVSACDAGNIDTSTFSKNLKALETSLDCKLTSGAQRETKLNASGERFYELINTFFGNLVDFTALIDPLGKNLLKIAGDEAVIENIFLPQLDLINRDLDNRVNFSVHATNSNEAYALLRSGDVDCAFINESYLPFLKKSNKTKTCEYEAERIVNVLYYLRHSKSIWDGQDFKKLVSLPLVVQKDGDLSLNHIEAIMLEKCGKMPSQIIECSTFSQIIKLIPQGYYSFLPGLRIEGISDESILSHAIGDFGSCNISLVYKKNDEFRRNLAGTPKGLISEFLRVFRKFCLNTS